MAGVEILATHEVMATTFNWNVFVIGMIISIGGISFLTWKYPPGNAIVVIFCLLIYTSVIGAIASFTGEVVPNYVEYKVQLSDEVPMADFLSTYEIIDQEGQILTIKEKAVD